MIHWSPPQGINPGGLSQIIPHPSWLVAAIGSGTASAGASDADEAEQRKHAWESLFELQLNRGPYAQPPLLPVSLDYPT